MAVKPNPNPNGKYICTDSYPNLYPRTIAVWKRDGDRGSIRYAFTQRDAYAKPRIYIRRYPVRVAHIRINANGVTLA